jgi:hypothetical protein
MIASIISSVFSSNGQFTGGDVGSVMVNDAYANVCAESSMLLLIVARPMLCDKCRRRNIVSFKVEPEEAWRTVVLNRWKSICPSCIDAEAERAGVRYQFVSVSRQRWLRHFPTH